MTAADLRQAQILARLRSLAETRAADVGTIVEAMASHGTTISGEIAYLAWRDHSAEMAAEWLPIRVLRAATPFVRFSSIPYWADVIARRDTGAIERLIGR